MDGDELKWSCDGVERGWGKMRQKRSKDGVLADTGKGRRELRK